MCTEESSDVMVVCDVAIQHVRDALVDVPGINYIHLPGEGTRVINTQPDFTASFQGAVQAAINRDE